MRPWLSALRAVVCVAGLAACGFPKPERVFECTAPADCTAPDKPFCIANMCVDACQSPTDCAATPATPLCQTSSGACVACLDDAGCAADKPVCDATGACRGCTADAECPSGVCLEADGTCAAEGAVVYMREDGRDVGDCTKGTPCATLTFALSKVTQLRDVVALTAAQDFPASTIVITRPVYIRANGTDLHRSGTVVSISSNVVVTLDNVRLTDDAGSVATAVSVSSGGSLRLFGATVSGEVATTGGGVSAIRSTFQNTGAETYGPAVTCTDGTVAITESRFPQVRVTTTNCQVTIARSRFDSPGGEKIVAVSGGFARIESSLVVNTDAGSDSTYVASVAPGSAVRFNTFVTTSGVPSDGTAVYTDGTATITSNIFAYNSQHPFGSGKLGIARYSLFDSAAVSDQTAGANNQTGDASSFFVDRARKDFHLAPNSPARGKGESGVGVIDDLDGHPRPSQAPDIGAYQGQ